MALNVSSSIILRKNPLSDIISSLVFELLLPLKYFRHCSSLRVHRHQYGYGNNFDNSDTYYTSLLDKSTHKNHLNQIHAQIIVSNLQCNGLVVTKFIHASSNLGDVCYARELFDEFPEPYVFLWNAIIRGYAKNNMSCKAIEMYTKMLHAGVSPDGFTLPHVLKACGGLMVVEVGRAVHGQIFRHGFEADGFVQNGLVALYGKCGRIELARVVFDGLDYRTIVSWTSIISGYAQNGQPLEALRIFRQMREFGVELDWVALVSVVSAHTDVEDLEQGRSVHGFVIKLGLEFELDLQIALTTLYAKNGKVEVAKMLFDQVEAPNVIMWNAMISGFAKNGFANEAITYFQEMISKNVRPNSITVRSTILACAQAGSLEQARWMNDYIDNSEYRNDVFVSTALIDMYVKCGGVDLARKVFNQTMNKDVVVWSSMIVGYGLHGWAREAIDLFSAMKQAGVRPNDVTFIGLLTACNHSGLVDEGWEIFQSMKDYAIVPRHQHYACVVDLLGRAGYLEKAYDFILNMPIKPSISVWGALLSSCKIYHHVTLGEYAAEQLFSLDPYNMGHYVQLSNLYASAHMWSGVAKVRVLMKEKGLSKDLGFSMIEINGKLQAFRMGDKSHPTAKTFEELEMRV